MIKKDKKIYHDNHERWLVSYADFITLLFAFFTVLYATAQRDVEKEKKFEDSIKKAFRAYVEMGGGGGGDTGNYAGPREGSLLPPLIKEFPAHVAGPAELEDSFQRVLDSVMGEEEKTKFINSIKHDSVGVRITLTGSALFEEGSDSLSSQSIKALNEIGSVLKASRRRLIIEGHTDNLPIRTNKFPSNWDLASARATRIVRYLSQNLNIPSNRLVAVSYAEQRPIAPNSTEEGRGKNRRIEILLVSDENNNSTIER